MSTPTPAFDSHSLCALQEALNEACQWLSTRDAGKLDSNVRQALARRIVRSAGRGERDPKKLKAYALAGIASGAARR